MRYFLLIALLLLSACATTPDAENLGAGGSTPEDIVQTFVENFNLAFQDPNLAEPATRRKWAETLSYYFAPSERADQRAAFGTMFAQHALGLSQLAPSERISIIITWSSFEVIEQSAERARVAIVDGTVQFQWLAADGSAIRERSSAITELLGQEREGIPVLRVNGQWFITEG
jgi:hypothetical protein